MKSLDHYFAIAVTTATGTLFQFGNQDGFKSIDDVVIKTWVNYYDNCIALDFLKHDIIRKEGISSIWIDMTGKYNSSLMAVEVIPLDRSFLTDRTLKNTRLFYNGPNIVMEKGVPSGTYDDYILELNQDKYVENDPSKNCRNYPYQDYDNYNDCDKNFTLKSGDETLFL